jgi:hypothetical protein
MPRPANPALPQWIAAYEAGATCPEIAAAHSMSPIGIWTALKKAGVAMRPAGGGRLGLKRRTSAWHADAVAARERGDLYKVIAYRVGRSENTVRAAVRLHRHRRATA